MATTFSRIVCPVLAANLVSGCGGTSDLATARADTGAGAVAKSFFVDLVRGDWPAAYEKLDATSRAKWNQEQFAGRAQAAMKQVGFTPTGVSVSVSESRDEASAVAVYRGGTGTNPKQFRDGTGLRKTPQGWFVVLRNNFGIPAPAPPRKTAVGPKG